MSDRTVSVLLKAQVDGFVSGMKKAESATKTLEDKTKDVAKSHRLLIKTAETVGVVGGIAIGTKLVNAASDLNETLSKTQVVFGKNADAVIAWSQTTATSLGMSQQQAAEAAATFGNLFVAMNLGGKQSADMSTRLVQLAGDLASFNNTNPADALEALRAGLVGEVEPLRRYGVNLNDAQLRQEALSLGLVKTTKDVLPPAIRAQAAYAMILDQTKTAQGDFARTSSGLANSQRIFSAEIANAQANLGRAFLPAVTSSVGALNDFLDAFNSLPAPIQNVLVLTGAVSATVAIAAPKIVAMKAALTELGISSKVTGGALKALGAATAALAIVAVVQDFQKANQAIEDFNNTLSTLESKPVTGQAIDDLRSSIQSLSHDIDDPGMFRYFRQGIGMITQGISGLPPELDRMTSQLDKASGDYARFTEATGNAAFALGITTSRAKELAIAAGVNLSGSVQDITQQIVLYGKAQGTGSVASVKAADAMNVLSDKTSTVTDRLKALQDQWDATTGGMLDASDAEIAAQKSLDDMSKSLKDNGNKWRTTTDAGRANQSQLNDSIRTFEDLRTKLIETGQATEQQANAKMVAYLKTLRDELPKSAKGARAEVDALIKKYSAVPAKVSTKFTADTAEALTAIQKIRLQWAEVVNYIKNHPAEAAAHYGLPAPKKGKGHAGGGRIDGPGTSTSDSILTPTSVGEYVVQASSVDKYGSMLDQINAGTWSPAQPMPSSSTPAAIALSIAAAPVVLQIGYDQIWKGLLQYKADRGGGSLGL